jgi:hypothetical protein
MKMKRLIIVCAWLAAGAAASCQGTGGPARSPIDPFASEATVGGNEPSGGGSETLLELCGRACANIAACEAGSAGCAADCASDVPAACEAEFRAFVQCIATAPICINGNVDPTSCMATLLAVDACASRSGGGASGGGTGMAGATGTSAPPPR